MRAPITTDAAVSLRSARCDGARVRLFRVVGAAVPVTEFCTGFRVVVVVVVVVVFVVVVGLKVGRSRHGAAATRPVRFEKRKQGRKGPVGPEKK